MATIACILLCGKNDFKAVMLLWKLELLFTVGLKDVKVVRTDNVNALLIRYKGSMDIFGPLNIKLNK
jgi:hypothetical protein